MTVLSGTGLSKSYGRKEVVREISVSLGQGEVVGLLGPNGAGKTTTFYMLAGIVPPTHGQVFLDEDNITGLALHERARKGMSYLPQENSVFKKLTVLENLMIILEQMEQGKTKRLERAKKLLDELGITKLMDQKAMYLSGGERRRLEIARALILSPKFMLLDEPFAGIDPIAVDEIQQIITGLRSQDIGVLISDHNVRETLNICDRAYLVFEGRVIFEGTPKEIVGDQRARRLYLGEDFCL